VFFQKFTGCRWQHVICEKVVYCCLSLCVRIQPARHKTISLEPVSAALTKLSYLLVENAGDWLCALRMYALYYPALLAALAGHGGGSSGFPFFLGSEGRAFMQPT